jgi:asparagine synthase (glutamine-hydrolysing)
MCGVGAIVQWRDSAPGVRREALLAMGASLAHRGPDGMGIYRRGPVGLVHTRLAIVDLAGGAQPLANESNDVWVAFNGEIFNHLELRAELEALGHRFTTRSDTEVIVHAWESWREQAFERFNGQWAVVLFDERSNEVVLSRDRLGVRPLHWAEHDGCLFVASEAKAIFAASPSFPRRVDPASVAEALTFWAPPSPRTMYVGVDEVPPGTTRVLRLGQGFPSTRDVHTYRPRFTPSVDAFDGDVAAAVTAVGDALEEAVRLRITRADVPVASYLSGGLDSTLVSALAQRVTGGRLRTFSLRFADASYDEGIFQEEAVRALATEHEAVVVDDRAIAEVFPTVVAHTEKTLVRTAPAPLFLLSQHVRRAGVKVVLTGEGADEMFAGYDLFREAKVRRFWARHPASPLRPKLLERLYPYLQRSPSAQRAMARAFFGRDLDRSNEADFAHGPRWSSGASLLRLLGEEARREATARARTPSDIVATMPAEAVDWSPLARDQLLEIETLLTPYILCSQGDRMLMANSIEGRFPFLDSEVMALAHRLPADYKLRVLDEKHVLKRFARDLVPPRIIDRKKQPYRAPNASAFMRGQVPEWVTSVTSARSLREVGLFDHDAVTALVEKLRAAFSRNPDFAPSNADDMAIVAVLSTQILALTAPPVGDDRAPPLQVDVERFT